MFKRILTFCLILIVIPLSLFAGAAFGEKYAAFISLFIAIISLVPLFYCFEKKQNSSNELTVIAVMIALSVAGRVIFSLLPGFKPVTAIAIIAGLYLGKEAGFAVGSMSAVISNFYFGQGAWTPFQMLSWGLIGFIAGLFSKPCGQSRIFRWIFLFIYSILAGLMFSAMMDIFTTLSFDGEFNLSRFLTFVIAAAPTTIGYIISNIVFLAILCKPIGTILNRLKNKYGLFKES
jgi:energy-coupling factor transport system substrate-specific component